MRFSALRRVISRGRYLEGIVGYGRKNRFRDGQPEWKEVSQMYFPKGGKTLTLVQRGLFGILGLVFVGCYMQFQTEINPESKWAKVATSLLNDPARALGLDQTEDKPKPSWSSHIQ
ncbi:hypothetical protein PMAYCL1PPCAC_20172 [Pristionchus mayeri]|uniref:Uncharacterized protein n=1 Tax=Pristionchus mayeri TaxID=1317129 RepID=A0AAN5I2W0_9BILA|nr:hypothetical protein PMAYCL1PPCAC_20172 [Pristionchus mayeri]